MTRLALLLCLLALPAWAGQIRLDPNTPIRIVDGDSLVIGDVRARLNAIDAPEIRGRCPAERALAQAARAYLATRIDNAETLIIQPLGKRDRYGRELVTVRADGGDVAAEMIERGLARAYYGRGKRGSWC